MVKITIKISLLSFIGLLFAMSSSAQICEQHNFGSSSIQMYVYADGRSWDFSAEKDINVSSIETQSILAGPGGTFNIQVKVNDVEMASWTQVVNTTTYQGYSHSANVEFNLQIGDTITYFVSGGTMSSPVGAITGPNYVKLCGSEIQENNPPLASDMSIITAADTPKSDTLMATDPEAAELTYSIVEHPTNGIIQIDNASTGAFTYTPDSGFFGTDVFTFKANDGIYDSNSATVTVTVEPPPGIPVATDMTLTTLKDMPKSDMLTATDPNGDPLTYSIVEEPTNGAVQIDNTSTGAFTYTPDSGFSGTDTFSFKVNDGTNDSNIATVTITVQPPPLGDVNDNGKIDIFDALMIAKLVINLIAEAEVPGLDRANVDCIEGIDIYDALMIAEVEAGIRSFPNCQQ